VALGIAEAIVTYCTPMKMNRQTSKNHPMEKENHLNQTFIFLGLPNVIFSGCMKTGC